MRVLGALLGLLLASTAAHAGTVTAQRAADFQHIWGVSGAGYGGTAAQLQADIDYIGIKRWRSGKNTNVNTALNALNALHPENLMTAIGGTWYTNQSTHTIDIPTAIASMVSANNSFPYDSIEGFNEPVFNPINYNGALSSNTNGIPIAQWMRDFYSAIKANSTLQNLTVYTVSLAGGEGSNVGLQCMVLNSTCPGSSGVTLMAANTRYANGANEHTYPMNHGHAQSVDQTLDSLRSELYNDTVTINWYTTGTGYTQAQADALPKIITEYGYHLAAPGAGAGNLPTDGVVAGKDTVTALLNAWDQGYSLLALYTMYDWVPDGYKLFNGVGSPIGAPGTPLPAATYMHNMMGAGAALRDTAGTARTFTPGSLTYTITGLPATGKSTLLEKANGTFELVIWNNISNWNFAAGTAITVASTNVTVTLGASAPNLNVYNPTSGISAVQTLTNATTVTVGLTDYPLIIEIVPGAGTVTDSLSASPTSITSGGSSTLTWSSTNASSCTGTGFSTASATSGTVSVSPTITTSYSVSCAGTGGPAIANATVTVTGTVTDSLSSSPTSIMLGSSATLTWNSANATSCTGTNFFTGGANSGTVSVCPKITTDYSVSCAGPGGPAVANASIAVVATVVDSLSANPASIQPGESSILAWSSTNATACIGAGLGFSTGGALSGSISVTPRVSTNYFVSCAGPGGPAVSYASVAVGGGGAIDPFWGILGYWRRFLH